MILNDLQHNFIYRICLASNPKDNSYNTLYRWLEGLLDNNLITLQEYNFYINTYHTI